VLFVFLRNLGAKNKKKLSRNTTWPAMPLSTTFFVLCQVSSGWFYKIRFVVIKIGFLPESTKSIVPVVPIMGTEGAAYRGGSRMDAGGSGGLLQIQDFIDRLDR
jgi:hypothetical protein